MLYDDESGLYWMSVRAYDPTLGRFLQHDPVFEFTEGSSAHSVVSNEPMQPLFVEKGEKLFFSAIIKSAGEGSSAYFVASNEPMQPLFVEKEENMFSCR